MLSPEELGSASAELIRILLFHSYTQRASIVASPPIGGSSHKKEKQRYLCISQIQEHSSPPRAFLDLTDTL